MILRRPYRAATRGRGRNTLSKCLANKTSYLEELHQPAEGANALWPKYRTKSSRQYSRIPIRLLLKLVGSDNDPITGVAI